VPVIWFGLTVLIHRQSQRHALGRYRSALAGVSFRQSDFAWLANGGLRSIVWLPLAMQTCRSIVERGLATPT